MTVSFDCLQRYWFLLVRSHVPAVSLMRRWHTMGEDTFQLSRAKTVVVDADGAEDLGLALSVSDQITARAHEQNGRCKYRKTLVLL